MAKRFEDKVAIVTGGARGMGRAISLGFAREGANIGFCDLLEEEANQTGADIKAAGSDALFMKVDITDNAAVIKWVKAVEDKFGKIDIVVNCAGYDMPLFFLKCDEERRAKSVAINFTGPMNVTHAALPGMIERNYGKIIFISSDAGRVGQAGSAVYSGCKGAVIALGKSLARELVRNKINVNSIAPGPTDGPLLQESAKANPKLIEALNKSVPWGRVAQPEEIAEAVLFLCSDAAGYITGQTLSVNGGLNMAW